MNKLTYDTVEHKRVHGTWGDRGEAKYGIDWTRCEEKFKSPAPQLRVYQGGRIEISSNTYRDPSLRRAYANTYGIHFRLLNELRGKLYTPDGAQVMRSQIKGDILLLDYEFKRVLAGREINYVAPGYPPASGAAIEAYSRQPEKEKQLLEKCRDVLALATTVHALGQKPQDLQHWQRQDNIIEYLRKPKQLDPVQHALLLWQLGAVQAVPGALGNCMRTACLLHTKHDYLVFK